MPPKPLRARTAPPSSRTTTVRAGTATGERVRLSVYDLVNGTFATPRVFFHRHRLDAAALRDSLAATLPHFPLLTGRLVRDPDGGLSVRCDDSGIPFTESHSDRPMPDYGPDHPARPDLNGYLHRANAFRVVDHDTPLLTVRVTHMRDGGSVLGIAINHGIADGASHLAFLQHWQRVHAGQEPPAPVPYTRDPFNTLRAPAGEPRSTQYTVVPGRQKFRFVWRVNAGARSLRTVTLRFTADEIAALKDHARTGGSPRISSGDALTAHVWRVLAALRGRPAAAPERLGVVVGLRQVLRDHLPGGYWGNGITNVTAQLPAGRLREAPLPEVAATIRESLSALTEARIREEAAWLDVQRRARRMPRVLSRMALDSFDTLIGVNNVGRLPVYELDFGAGPAFWFGFPGNPIPWSLLITPTPAGDAGRDIHIGLPKDYAQALRTPEYTKRLHAYG
ncbi:acyltransferase [Streptomyces sp. NPDC047000]|uniref:acyltransferase n=1 Tax=Streptomyces sp. NPDC047000 TaxID=3155474 RepID=UPI003402596D